MPTPDAFVSTTKGKEKSGNPKTGALTQGFLQFRKSMISCRCPLELIIGQQGCEGSGQRGVPFYVTAVKS